LNSVSLSFLISLYGPSLIYHGPTHPA